MIAVPASMVTGPIASSGDGVAAGVWASLHHTATLLSLDDANLVACAVGTPETAPDAEAFGVLYERYVQRVFAFALSRLHDRTQAEDVTSQTVEPASRPPVLWLLPQPAYAAAHNSAATWPFRPCRQERSRCALPGMSAGS